MSSPKLSPSTGTLSSVPARSRASSLAIQETGQRRGSTVAPVFLSQFSQGDKLGAGAFSVVYDCTENITHDVYAVKIMDRSKFNSPKLREMIDNEIKILQSLSHPQIISLKAVFQEPTRICIVTEKLTGGELMRRMNGRAFSEKDSREIVTQILKALRYMHEKGVIHRDLKPENILLVDEKSLQIKISDFGLSVFRTKDATMESAITDMAGTPHYMAPELLRNQSYDKTVDVWSVGVIMYLLLSGRFPFESNSQAELFEAISSGKFVLTGGVWNSISEDAKSLLRRLLKVVPSERYSVDEALRHPWITGDEAGDEAQTIVEMMRAFNLARKLKRAMLTVYAAVVWKKRGANKKKK